MKIVLWAKRFGRRVKAARAAKGLTQKELGDRVGLSPSYIGRIERGERLKIVERLHLIARSLGTTLSDLFK